MQISNQKKLSSPSGALDRFGRGELGLGRIDKIPIEYILWKASSGKKLGWRDSKASIGKHVYVAGRFLKEEVCCNKKGQGPSKEFNPEETENIFTNVNPIRSMELFL